MELTRSSNYDGFESNFESDIESVFQIDQLTAEVQSNFGKLEIKYKIGLRLFLFSKFGAKNI